MRALFILTFSLFALTVYSQSASEKLDAIFQEIDSFNNQLDPQDSLWAGHHVKGPFSKIDAAYFEKIQRANEAFMVRLNDLSNQDLSSRKRSVSN